MNIPVRRPLVSHLQRLVFSEGKLPAQAPRFFPRTMSRSLSQSFRSSLGYYLSSLTSRKMAPSTPDQLASQQPEYEDFFRYTSGRWVWDEEQQLRDRYRRFNVAELQNIAAKSVGSDGCVSMTKLAEGGYNKVFRLLMSDGKTVIARIPNPNAGPPFYTTASEVATVEFVRNWKSPPMQSKNTKEERTKLI